MNPLTMRLFIFLAVNMATTLVAAKDYAIPHPCSIVSCRRNDERCILDDNNEPICVPPCAKVCPNIPLSCKGFVSEPPYFSFDWVTAENTFCWQIEYHQYTDAPFLRTRCKCPERNYSESNDCGVNMAHLSFCIQATIIQDPEINFGDVNNVRIGMIQSNGDKPMFDDAQDIDFQGHVQHSTFCLVDAQQDVEFGGANETCGCGGIFEHNTVLKMIMGDDLQFEEGTIVNDNAFRQIVIGDKFKFDDEDGGPCLTVVDGNDFRNVLIADKCKIENLTNPINFTNNDCDVFEIIDEDNHVTCDGIISDGLSCPPTR